MTSSSEQNPPPPVGEGYWTESRQPLASLVFLAPLLALYEVGVLLLGVQNGADAFMRRILDMLGFSQHFLLPILTVCILLGWHHLVGKSWRISAGVQSAMAAESILLAICLWCILYVQKGLFAAVLTPATLSIAGQFRNAIGFLGTGIYEELLFRLILLTSVAWGLRRCNIPPARAMMFAAILTSLFFSAAHYRFLSPYGDPFDWFSFLFRFVAGMFFSVVFIYRGFGIAAGSHAAYDILVSLFA